MVGGSQVTTALRLKGTVKDSMYFQQHLQHVFDHIPVSCLKFPEAFDSQNLLWQSSCDNNSPERTAQGGSIPQLGDSLQTVAADSFLYSYGDTFCETYSELPCHDVPLYEHFTREHNKLADQVACASSGNSASSTSPKSKRRIKWTKDLHEQFVAAVNSLGGPQKAKPKAVLHMMDSKSLTIFHVKSHLQKYRTTMSTQNTLKERHEEGQGRDVATELQQKIYMQIEESRHLQLEIRRSVQEQLEIQRNLQMLLEQQKKQLHNV